MMLPWQAWYPQLESLPPTGVSLRSEGLCILQQFCKKAVHSNAGRSSDLHDDATDAVILCKALTRVSKLLGGGACSQQALGG